jgi:hypothetical protein
MDTLYTMHGTKLDRRILCKNSLGFASPLLTQFMVRRIL